MIYSYNKSQRDALFLKFVLVKMFRADLLAIIRSLSTLYTAIGVCRTSSVDCPLADTQHNYCCVYSVETPDNGE